MARYVVRVWVPDRPGALGQVASRIGAVKADVVGIEILERGGGRAVDELIIDVEDPAVRSLLVAEIGQVDGVDVEDIRLATDADVDPDLVALERSAAIVTAGAAGAVETLCAVVADCIAPDWLAVVDPASTRLAATSGDGPGAEWLVAFAGGAVAAAESGALAAADDVAHAALGASGLVVVIGRSQPPIRTRERRRLDALAAVAGSTLR